LVRHSLAFLVVLPFFSAICQTPAPSTFQQKVALAFNPSGAQLTSVSVSGSASWISGSQRDTGNLKLQLSADGSTNETWSLSTEGRSYVKGPLGSPDLGRVCSYTDAKGSQHPLDGPNCLRAIPWFFPSFAIHPTNVAVSSVVDSTDAAASNQGLKKITYKVVIPTPPSTRSDVLETFAKLQDATAETIYYDSENALPKKLVYEQMSDADQSKGIEISVEFSDYRAESGFMIPHEIRQYVQRTLQLDFHVSEVAIH